MILTPSDVTAVRAFARVFQLEADGWRLLHRSEGIVIEASRGAAPVILKIAASGAPLDALQARLDWVWYLHEHGMRVPDLLASRHGELAETIAVDGVPYAAYAYHSIPLGDDNTIDWLAQPRLPFQLGAWMGQMHSLAKEYTPRPNHPQIEAWGAGLWICAPERVIHSSQEPIISAIYRLRASLASLPRDPATFGIIHDDLHTGNVFHQHGELVVIDFDNCNRSWFAADIASALLFRVWIGPEKEAPGLRAAARVFLRDLIQGYRTQAAFPEEWLGWLPLLLKLREASLFQSFYSQVDVTREAQDDFFWYVYRSVAENRPFLPVEVISGG